MMPSDFGSDYAFKVNLVTFLPALGIFRLKQYILVNLLCLVLVQVFFLLGLKRLFRLFPFCSTGSTCGSAMEQQIPRANKWLKTRNHLIKSVRLPWKKTKKQTVFSAVTHSKAAPYKNVQLIESWKLLWLQRYSFSCACRNSEWQHSPTSIGRSWWILKSAKWA